MKVAIYVRISQDREGSGAGVERQEEDSRRLVASRWPAAEVIVFRDNDRSASGKRPRPAWNRLLAAIRADDVTGLAAYSSSRLYRRPADLAPLIDLVRSRPGFEIATVASGRLDLTTADGRMIAGILADVDQGEIERIQERVIRARKQRLARGLYGGGKRPYGHDATVTHVVPEEAANIRDAARRLLRGESIASILRRWEESGVTTTRGGKWSSSSFRSMMRSPRLAGIHPETGERAAWDAILTRRDHHDLRALFDEPGRLRSPRGGRYLLTGLVYGECGGRMTGNPQRGRRRYVCRAHGLHLVIDADKLEAFVVDAAPDVELRDVHDPRAESAPLLEAIDQIDAKLATFASEAAAAGLRAADIRAGSAALQEERSRLEASLDSVPPGYTWADLAAQTETRAWLEAVIDRIVIHPARRPQFDPGRVEIRWQGALV
ncbi:MAG: recombinase family protein [Actinomycetota bacterium]